MLGITIHHVWLCEDPHSSVVGAVYVQVLRTLDALQVGSAAPGRGGRAILRPGRCRVPRVLPPCVAFQVGPGRRRPGLTCCRE